jgi:hypothetical protein
LPASGPIEQLDFTADGKKLAVLVQNERAVRLWDLDRLHTRLKEMGLGW